MKAATKGHVQAIKALQLEESSKKNSDLRQNSKYNLKMKLESRSIKENVLTKLNSYNNNLMTNLSDERVTCDNFKNFYDNSINSKSSINMFLPPGEDDSYFNVSWTMQSRNQLPLKESMNDWRIDSISGIKSAMV
jgi:type IV secretory pathway VirB4 component